MGPPPPPKENGGTKKAILPLPSGLLYELLKGMSHDSRRPRMVDISRQFFELNIAAEHYFELKVCV
jgi:hypothetical protein